MQVTLRASYNLIELCNRGVRLNIRKCPRCGGYIYWPLRWVMPHEVDLYKDKMKCYSCGRTFYLARNGGKNPTWRQWPERDEEISEIAEDLTVKGEGEDR